MFTLHDQLGRTLTLNEVPNRIISIVPSQTELLFHLGLNEQVVGITKFCVHPDAWYRQKTRVGGTKNLNIEKIRSISPDLVIANKEENLQVQVKEIESFCPVWVSDVNDVASAIDMIQSIGALTGKTEPALQLASKITEGFAGMSFSKKLKACYLIWKDPFMTVGGDTFISNMMDLAGFDNIFNTQRRYPTVSVEDLRQTSFDVLLLSSEPYPFNASHVQEMAAILPGKKIIIVDGEMFSWYGSRLLHAPGYFKTLHQEIVS